jgi:hypothetical protein
MNFCRHAGADRAVSPGGVNQAARATREDRVGVDPVDRTAKVGLVGRAGLMIKADRTDRRRRRIIDGGCEM